VRDIINWLFYQHYEKRLEQQTGRPSVIVCAAEDNVLKNYNLIGIRLSFPFK